MKQIACTNCGAKYKLPDSFKSDKAKCKACGSVIDVAAQLGGDGDASAAAKPAAAKPAAAKPARAKPATARRSARSDDDGEKRSPRRGGGTTGRTKVRDEGDDGSAARKRSRVRGAGRTTKPAEGGGGNKGLMIGGSILGVALLVVIGVWAFSGDEKPETDDVANNTDPKAGAQANQPEDDNKKAAEATTPKEDDAKAGEADAKKDDKAAAEATAKKNKPAKPAKPKVKEPTTPEEVYDPKAELQPVEWPDSVTEDEIKQIEQLCKDVVDGGLAGSRATPKLEAMGYKSLPGIVNAMRELNYLDSDDTMTGFVFSKLLRQMTMDGYQVPFVPVDLGEDVPLKTAHQNALTVKDWRRFAERRNSEESWNEYLEKMKKASKKK